MVKPKLDGFEVCRRLRANPETRNIQILAVTGRMDMVDSVIAAGADACLTKPFEFSDVNRKLDQLLGLPEHIGVLSTDRSR